jgi:hypothetical protein
MNLKRLFIFFERPGRQLDTPTPYIRFLQGVEHSHFKIIYTVPCTFSFFYSALNSNLHNGILM